MQLQNYAILISSRLNIQSTVTKSYLLCNPEHVECLAKWKAFESFSKEIESHLKMFSGAKTTNVSKNMLTTSKIYKPTLIIQKCGIINV